MLLTKGQLHNLVPHAQAASIPLEVKDKLDLLESIFREAGVRDAQQEGPA